MKRRLGLECRGVSPLFSELLVGLWVLYTCLLNEKTIWNPSGRMDFVDMGHDFFLIKFELQSDLD